MLFTHFGVSGPLALEASCHLPEPARGAKLAVDLKPGLTREQLDARLRRDFSEAGKKQFKSVLPGLLPASLAEEGEPSPAAAEMEAVSAPEAKVMS